MITLLLMNIGLVAAQSPPAAAPAVVVSAALEKSFPLSAEALGNARANESIEVRPEITARITAILFEEGRRVEQGDLLVKLENAEQLAGLAAARAALLESASQRKRSAALFKTQVVSAAQLEQLQAKEEADAAAVEAAESRLAQTLIRAPFAGRVGLRRVSIGAVVDRDTVITTLDDTTVIKLDFDVPEIFMARLERGLNVTARSAAWPDTLFHGEVASIDTRVDPVTRTIVVRALVPNADGQLRPGMFLTVSLLKDDVRALIIPEQAVVPERSRQFVFVVSDAHIVELREIRTGRRRPGEVEVLEGLAAGENVITEGTQKVRPGQPVTLIPQATIEGGS